MKTTKRSSILKSILILVVLTVPAVVSGASQQLSDPGDAYSVSLPVPNSTVSGNVTARWKISDDEQSSVPYELLLMNKSCLNRVGTIKTGNAPSSSNNFDVTWPSGGPIQGKSSINDGAYCIQLCVSLLDSGAPYSACNLRIINVRNNNNPPVITTNPPADKTILPSESWSYNVNAVDADGDSFSFRFAKSPGFLKINSKNGKITTKATVKNPGEYTVKVVVEDTFGGKDRQTFKIIVRDDPADPIDVPVDPIDPVDQNAEVDFLFPISGDQLTGDLNFLSWQISETSTEIVEINLYYSKVATDTDWIKIVTLSPENNNYQWDVSDLDDGSYLMQLEIIFDNGDIETFISEQFEIKNEEDNGIVDTKLLVIEVTPENLSEIKELQPTVTGKFVPPAGGSVNVSTFNVFLDAQDITVLCTVDASGFSCELDEDLLPGAHQISVKVKDDKGKETVKEWNFTITDPNAVDPGSQVVTPVDDQGLAQNTLVLIGIICLVALILLIVPWVLYTMWKRRNDEYDGETVDIEYDSYDQPEAIDPNQFTSYEDYFSAASDGTAPQTIVNYYEPEQTVPAVQSSSSTTSTPVVSSVPVVGGVSTPDYVDFYQDPSGSGSADNKPSATDSSSSGSPSWLNPVSSGNSDPFSDPLPATESSQSNSPAPKVDKNDPLAPAVPDSGPIKTSSKSSKSNSRTKKSNTSKRSDRNKNVTKNKDPFEASLGTTDSDSSKDPFALDDISFDHKELDSSDTTTSKDSKGNSSDKSSSSIKMDKSTKPKKPSRSRSQPKSSTPPTPSSSSKDSSKDLVGSNDKASGDFGSYGYGKKE